MGTQARWAGQGKRQPVVGLPVVPWLDGCCVLVTSVRGCGAGAWWAPSYVVCDAHRVGEDLANGRDAAVRSKLQAG